LRNISSVNIILPGKVNKISHKKIEIAKVESRNKYEMPKNETKNEKRNFKRRNVIQPGTNNYEILTVIVRIPACRQAGIQL
jgi:hypothetical protein